MGLLLNQVLWRLEQVGLPVSDKQVRYIIAARKIPKPRRNSIGWYEYSEEDYRRIEDYFREKYKA